MPEHQRTMGQTRKWGNMAAILSALALGLAWPIFIYGSISYGWDSSGYYRGGRFAVQTALGERAVAHVAPAAGAEPGAAPQAEARPTGATSRAGVAGLRSITYSVAAYLLSWPGVSLAPLVWAQIFALVGLVAVLLDMRRRADRLVPMLAASGVLAVGSTLPIFATLATPDVFAGAMIAALAGLAAGNVRGAVARAWLAAIVVAAVTAHQSHVALALVALVVAGTHVIVAWRRRMALSALRAWRLPVIAIVGGLVLNLASSLIGFGEVSVTPKHFPFALARSIEDGPARWYLERACPVRRYAVCELYPRGIPAGNYEFLWGKNGVAVRATAEQMDRIRAEEPAIVGEAVAAYPFHQIKASLLNFWRQISMVGIDPAMFQSIRLDATGEIVYVTEPPVSHWLVVLQRAVLAASLAFLAWRWRRLARTEKAMVALALLLILANDAICGAISAPDIRYQNRVLWVVVLFALSLALTSRARRRADGAS